MKLFHRMMILTLILCLVFGLGGCTQEKSPSEPEESSSEAVIWGSLLTCRTACGDIPRSW